MKLTGDYLQIAKLISQELTGELSKVEDIELDKWLSSSSENKELYSKIQLEIITHINENKSKNIIEYNIWNKIKQETVYVNKTFAFTSLLKYVAILVLAFATSGIIYFNYSKNKDQLIVDDYSIDSDLKPGGQKALLVTSDGISIELNQGKNDSIREEDGSLIENNKNALTYTDSDNSILTKKKKEKIIYNTLITPKGGEYSLVLADGTKVWLNANSKLIYPVKFIGEIREIKLEGEAYFEVNKDPRKPFIVKTNEYNVNVLGTSFNVSAYNDDDQVTTTLVEGVVKIGDFDSSGKNVQIKPNEQFILNKVEKGILIKKVDVSDFIGWKEGRFIFAKQELKSILSALSRWYNFDFQFENKELEAIIFTGNMDKYDQLNTALDMIAKTNKVNFKIEDNLVLVTTKE